MLSRTDDLRIQDVRPVSTPWQVVRELPPTPEVLATVERARAAAGAILSGGDDRLLVVAGPCSIHDPAAAGEYAARLAAAREAHAGDLEIVMRVYFEKPRTTVGWKGLINDPDLDGSFNIEKGLRAARALLLQINTLGLPVASEFLDMITPQYIADLVSWGAIGARTTESQVHRELASGLSCPVGFKNGTSGDVQVAIDAIRAAARAHHFMTVTKWGVVAIAETKGNAQCHIVLRGGRDGPNYQREHVSAVCAALARAGLPEAVMIDASHANSRSDPDNQALAADAIAAQIADGEMRVFGVMLESHLVAGKQSVTPGTPLVYGQSITDACMSWERTETVLDAMAASVRQRRARRAHAEAHSAVLAPSQS